MNGGILSGAGCLSFEIDGSPVHKSDDLSIAKNTLGSERPQKLIEDSE
jgi:hypothetical protein